MAQVNFQRIVGFAHDRRGTVTILSAVLLPAIMGIVALVAEFGAGLLTRVENQRVADLAAFAGALAYSSSGSATTMNAAIAQVATLNGLPSGAVSGTLVTSPTGTGNQAVSVAVSTSRLLLLAPILGGNSSLTINTGAQAEIAAQASACILALSGGGTGVTLSDGTAVTASSCAVASNTTVSVPCGTFITTKAVAYNSSGAPSQPCAGIQPPSGTSSVRIVKRATSDPLAGDAGVAAATARLSTVSAYTAPSAPTVTGIPNGTDIDFAWNQGNTQAKASAAGCSASFNSGTSTWTLTCPAGSTRNFGTITIGGGIKVSFNPTGMSTNIYNFSGPINNSNGGTMTFGLGTYNVAGSILANGSTTTFGDGNFNVAGAINASGTVTFGAGAFKVAQGLITGGGSTVTFGAGSFNIGPTAAACTGSERYSICHSGTALTFGGPSTFTLSAGLYVAGGSTVTFGSGSANSYQFGPSLGTGGGNALSMGGGAKTKLADATGASSLFKLVGNLNVVSGGGSCLALPAAAQHDVKGSIATAGGTILGSGNYTVTGYVALGGNGGGDVSCWGSTVGMNGSAVTLTVGGASTSTAASCAGTVFCLAAGYSNVTLTAPASGTTANLVVIGPTSASNTAGATFAEGASGTSLSGAFYFPYGPVTLSGGASVGSGAGQCLQLIGSQVSLTGGTTLATSCIGSTGGSSTALLVR